MERCLDRDPRHRLRDIGEARILLEDPTRPAIVDRRSIPAPAPLPWRRAIPLRSPCCPRCTGGSVWYPRSSTPRAVTRLSYTLPEGQSLSSGDRSVAAISPDGTQIVYVAVPSGLYLRSMSAFESRAIRGTEGNVNVGEPVFSPDGQSIVFSALVEQTLKRIPVTGGAPVTICRLTFPPG